jgi:hypothetical protein
MSRILAAGGGFLLAVLWMDLMFDVQALHLDGEPAHDASALHSIVGYYRRVTTDAFPMNRLIGAVMLLTVGTAIVAAVRRRRRRDTIAALLVAAPVGLALARIFPQAVQLGMGADPIPLQSSLATSILHGHVGCLAAIACFTALALLPSRER